MKISLIGIGIASFLVALIAATWALYSHDPILIKELSKIYMYSMRYAVLCILFYVCVRVWAFIQDLNRDSEGPD